MCAPFPVPFNSAHRKKAVLCNSGRHPDLLWETLGPKPAWGGRMYLAYTSWSQLVTKENQSRNSRQEPEVKKSERHGGVHLKGPSSPDAPWPAQEWPHPQWDPTGQSHGRILFTWSSHCPEDTSLCQADKNLTRIEDPHETPNLPALWSQSPHDELMSVI